MATSLLTNDLHQLLFLYTSSLPQFFLLFSCSETCFDTFFYLQSKICQLWFWKESDRPSLDPSHLWYKKFKIYHWIVSRNDDKTFLLLQTLVSLIRYINSYDASNFIVNGSFYHIVIISIEKKTTVIIYLKVWRLSLLQMLLVVISRSDRANKMKELIYLWDLNCMFQF